MLHGCASPDHFRGSRGTPAGLCWAFEGTCTHLGFTQITSSLDHHSPPWNGEDKARILQN